MKHKKKQTHKAEESEKATESEPKELRQMVEDLQNQKDELFDKLQRVSADYANFQKRVPKQISDSIAYEKERVIKTLLPALDNFEHTLQNAHTAEDVDVLVKGIRIIYDQLLDILKSHNVEQIKALGEKFDPSVHQAMTQKMDPDKEEDIVLEEFQKGYRLNDRVIRPSKVIVNKFTEEKPGWQQEPEPPEE
jgi:molecular chaperone GrpE